MVTSLRSIFHWVLGFSMAISWILVIGAVSLLVPTRRYHEFWRKGFTMITSAFGIKVVVKGLEHIDRSRGVIYMPNHVNSFEPFIAMPSIPQWCVAVEKEENFKIPIYGILIRSWGNISINRKDTAKAREQLAFAKELLAQGTCVAIMPEGTRSRDGRLAPFKKGGFHIAIETGVPIVPYAYKGLFDINHHGTFQLHPGTVEVIFTPPIDTREYTIETMPALMARVRAQIVAALGQTEEPPEALPTPSAATTLPPG